ncbi:NAD(P)H-hydrate dehydratase [Paludibacterium yongneupense]|uniref:NAD(P)H-hydrate dehydratase n=1 Tax=Paludibacterium yongneupense TaxID=400061 RepID=UPI000417D750|nr:NAD(P)H-hydrate dehydratase [Paludibacterium yongneupense]
MASLDRILDIEALRRLESRAEEAGVDLMARAACAAADWITSRYPRPARLLIAAGVGNNGGDALMAALLLHERGYRPDILVPATPASPATQRALTALRAAGVEPVHGLGAAQYDLIVDGLFGIGLSRPPDAPWSELIAALNASAAPILALDVPSGLDAWTGNAGGACIEARYTLTFLCHKPGLFGASGADLAGEIELAALDCPPDWLEAGRGEVNRPDASPLRRRRDSHKGSNGSIGIVGGACGMLGAALLAGRAALACGAGKVWIAALDPALAVDTRAPELMLLPRAHLPAADILAVGPGLGTSPQASALLGEALADSRPLVLDADALNLVAADHALADALSRRSGPSILTPHPAEAARLLACPSSAVQADRIAAATTLAERFACIVVLKGAGSLIAAPDGRYRINPTGGPALAAAGQGDVLCGIAAALLAQGMDAWSAACLSVFVHGLAGDDFQREQGGAIGLTASETAQRARHQLNRLVGQTLFDKLVGLTARTPQSP